MTRGPVKLGLAVLVAAMMTLLAACGGSAKPAQVVKAPPPQITQITDEAGRVITLDKVPERILSIAPSNTEILFALGLGDKVVGVTDYCDYPPEAKQKQSVGGYTNPDLETIVSLSPDLILATDVHVEQVIPALEKAGLTVAVIDPQTLAGVLDSMLLVGRLTGAENEAEALVDRLSARIKAVTDKTDRLTEAEKPRVFYAVWYDPLMSAGQGTFQDDLMVKAGGINIASNLEGWKTISLESVLEDNPQVMIAGINHASIQDKNFIFIDTDEKLGETDARKTGKVFGIDANITSRTGPRIVDGFEQMAAMIHPELFGK